MFKSGSKPTTKQPPTNHRIKVKSPFDSDSDSEIENKPATSSGPTVAKTNLRGSSYDENEEKGTSLYSRPHSSAAKKGYDNDFRDMGGFENQSVQELEDYAVYKAEDTTDTVKNCLRIAEDIREEATETLVTLHQQGEQITRTHYQAVNIDQDLSRGEKLLGSLGGMFSKTWKPKKSRQIKGPVLFRDDSFKRKGNHLEQRERLGLSTNNTNRRSKPRKYAEPTNALQKVEVEKANQDDDLDDISNVLGQLKGMALDMGTEIERQNYSLDHLQDDIDELNSRVKQSNQRGRRLLGK